MSGRPAAYAYTANGGADELAWQHSACALLLRRKRLAAPTRYQDKGGDRTGRDTMLAAIDAGEHRVLVVWDLARLMRNMDDAADLVERLDAAGCRLVTVDGGSSVSRQMLSLMAALHRHRV